jgi:cyanophycinase-like exopeptidase
VPQASVFRWRDGAGWIVLSGGDATGDFKGSAAGDIEGRALEHASAGKPLAYIWAAGDVETADRHLAALEELGAPTGYLIDVLTEDDDTIRSEIEDAGVIVLGDGPDANKLRGGLLGAAIEAIGEAHTRGAVILGIGQGAAVLGALLDDQKGLGWLENGIIMPNYGATEAPDRLREMLRKHPESVGLGLNAGSALAFGPDGQVESWGERQITITLGAKST